MEIPKKCLKRAKAMALTPQEWEGKASTVCELARDGEVVAV